MKKILFTGARSGIVSKVIDKLDDYFIYVTVHTESELKAVKNKYKNKSNIKCFKLDVTNKEDYQKLVDLDIDILFSNAAIGESGSVADINMDKIRNNFEVNVFSNFEIVQIVLKNMINKGKGRIIMMSSLAGIIPIPFLGSYCASKASIIKLTECLNLELKLLNNEIDVCLIEPGLYNTGFNKLMLDKKYDDVSLYFDKQLEQIKKYENIILKLFEKKKLDSIVNLIVKSINTNKVKRIYSAPLSQRLFAKIINFIIT